VISASRQARVALAASLALCAQSSWGVGGAQWAAPGPSTPVPSAPASAESAVAASPEIALAERVRSALDAAPYIYDRHVDVSVQNGNVVLTGFVFSDWDLFDTLRVARQAAKPHRVIDGLHIEVGGRR
jgi:hypothetical protein